MRLELRDITPHPVLPSRTSSLQKHHSLDVQIYVMMYAISLENDSIATSSDEFK